MNTPISKASSGPPLTSPPRPELAFRVGIVGHRPNRLKEADMEKLGLLLYDMLNAIKESVLSFKSTHGQYFEDTAPVLRAISPLAEGTDRLFADQALSLEYELCCVLPFFKYEYENDFLPGIALEENSLDRFRKLHSYAKTSYELDGSRNDNAMAYGAAGDVVLNQSDILIVVWDGVRQGKQGGTEETMDAAIKMGVPVIWISAKSPHDWQFIDKDNVLPISEEGIPALPSGKNTLEELKERVINAIDLPHTPDKKSLQDENAEVDLNLFYKEKQPKWRLSGFIWKTFRDLFGDNKIAFKSLKEKPFEDAVANEWPRDTSTSLPGIVNSLRPYYAWIDKIAVVLSDRYRSTYIVIYLLAAFSVGMALLPIPLGDVHPWIEKMSITAELISISVIILLVIAGKKCRWHGRWLDCRIGAELIRHLRLVAPLGGKRPYPQVPAHLSFGQIGSSWMAWYVLAVERKLGLPDTIVDRDYLKQSLSHIKEYISGQINFHQTTYDRSKKIEYRLHNTALILLILTFIACIIHLMHAFSYHPDLPLWLSSDLLIFITGFFPALGAALAGINSQGEFRRISKRSQMMCDHLSEIQKKVNNLEEEIKKAPVPGNIQYSTKVTSIVSDAARLFVNEVLDWRVIILDQPLKA